MYDELVKRLRECPNYTEACVSCPHEHDLGCRTTTMHEAADAIEELSKSKWIPVTERLPEEGQVVCVSDGKSTWDYGTFRGVFKANGQWHWKKRTLKTVKWWMPKSSALPEPPKEE